LIKREKRLQLTGRLLALAEMVPDNSRLADVGCDHGYLDIYLVQTGKCPHAIAMDVRKGPLSAAADHIAQTGLADRIETRLSDGLEMYRCGEADVLVCAGMGGPLMQKILTDAPDKTADFRELILQPQSEIMEFRRFLRENLFDITQERVVYEEGKYYFPMKAVKGKIPKDRYESEDEYRECFDRFGECLLKSKDPLVKQYLLEQKVLYEQIKQRLRTEGAANERIRIRLEEVEREAAVVSKALVFLQI